MSAWKSGCYPLVREVFLLPLHDMALPLNSSPPTGTKFLAPRIKSCMSDARIIPSDGKSMPEYACQ